MALGEPMTALPKRFRRPAGVALELVLPIALVVTWWTASAARSSFFFPPLSESLSALHDVWLFDHFGTDALPTLGRLAVGLGIALVVGIGTGVLIGSAPVVCDVISPILEFLRAVPGVALIPAALLLLGIGPTMQIALIAYGTVWPILLNTVDGVRGVDPVARDVVASYRIRPFDRLFRVVLPAAGPQIVAGARTALAVGITVLVFSELVGSTNGIGHQILLSQRTFQIADMWAGIIFLGIVGYLLNVAFHGVERVVLRWHRGMHAGSE